MADTLDPTVLRAQILAAIAKQQPTRLDPTAAWFPDINAAALAALDSITDKQREYSGLLLKRVSDGTYSYTVPVPGSEESFEVTASYDPKQFSMAGIYHTHPGVGESTHYFSPADIDTARKLNLPSFILPHSDGQMRRFDPTMDVKSDGLGLGRKSGRSLAYRYAPGIIVPRPQGLLTGAIQQGQQ
jgi:proteasome lid subunit RPN8/RPN11